MNSSASAIFVDMGTTNTRVWLMQGNDVLARSNAMVGVRDTARDGSTSQVHTVLKELITAVLSQTNSTAGCRPDCVAAAGMIGSPLGLAEVPHVAAPAGLLQISEAARWFQFPEITELPFLIVPGVRTGPTTFRSDALVGVDVMRGEETLCLGLIDLALVQPPAVVLNLGSHWKAIRLAEDGQVQLSITSLSGELIHSAQAQTVLASSVSSTRPEKISEPWLMEGMTEQRHSNLPRALFCVRLLELSDEGTPEDRYSFLVGAFIAADLDALFARGLLHKNIPVVISGGAAIAEAWRKALQESSVPVTVLTTDETEKAFLAGLHLVVRSERAVKQIKDNGVPLVQRTNNGHFDCKPEH